MKFTVGVPLDGVYRPRTLMVVVAPGEHRDPGAEGYGAMHVEDLPTDSPPARE